MALSELASAGTGRSGGGGATDTDDDDDDDDGGAGAGNAPTGGTTGDETLLRSDAGACGAADDDVDLPSPMSRGEGLPVVDVGTGSALGLESRGDSAAGASAL
jgi:hypothetical protein